MDLDRPVIYRGVDLNALQALQPAEPLVGQIVNEARFLDVEGWGYREKRSLRDGYDVSDVYLGMRNLIMRGTVYAKEKPDLHDRVRLLRNILTPTLAFAANKGDKGFLPLQFEVPTTNTTDWPSGYITLVMYARPADQPGFAFVRDTAHVKSDGFSIPYEVRMEARDPVFYHPIAQQIYIDAASKSGTFLQRGDYVSPLNIVIKVPAASAAQRVLTFDGGGTKLTLTVPGEAKLRTVRLDSIEKVVTYETTQGGTTKQELRLDLVNFDTAHTWPVVSKNGSPWSFTFGGGLPDTVESYLVYNEAFV